MEESKLEKKQGKRGGKIVVGICVVIILLLTAVIVVLLKGDGEAEENEPMRNVVVTKDTAETVYNEMLDQEYIKPGYYSASMSTTWHFTTGDAISEDAYVENLEENTNDVYFDVFLADNEDEALFESPILPRGSELDNIALDTVLSAGTYDCVMIYHLIDEEQNTVSTLRVGLTIIVEG